MRELSEREQWFRAHVGMRLWRNNYCDCDFCKKVYEKGLIITDEIHADACYSYESDFTAGGDPLRYFSSKEERDTWEASLLKSKL